MTCDKFESCDVALMVPTFPVDSPTSAEKERDESTKREIQQSLAR